MLALFPGPQYAEESLGTQVAQCERDQHSVQFLGVKKLMFKVQH